MTKPKPDPFTYLEFCVIVWGCWVIICLDTEGFSFLTGRETR